MLNQLSMEEYVTTVWIILKERDKVLTMGW